MVLTLFRRRRRTTTRQCHLSEREMGHTIGLGVSDNVMDNVINGCISDPDAGEKGVELDGDGLKAIIEPYCDFIVVFPAVAAAGNISRAREGNAAYG